MIVGVDEVGRGCLAGPVVAGAVLLARPIIGLKDSKQLSKRRREALAATIQVEAVAYGLGWVDAATIDEVGITTAVKRAMELAVAAITAPYDKVIIDGNYNFLASHPMSRTLVKADALVPAVSAASILAKVMRDKYMAEAAIRYPGYAFERHVGYGTAEHLRALQALGPSNLHRRSFAPLKDMV